MYVEARGAYFGGIANVAVTDVFDVPGHDPDFNNVARAADQAMISVLTEDLASAREDTQIREFLTLEAA